MLSLKEFKEYKLNSTLCVVGGADKTTYTTYNKTTREVLGSGNDTRECIDGRYFYKFDDGTSGFGSSGC